MDVQAGEFNPRLRKCEHGVILKVTTTNICGSDQHMVRGRTTAEPGFVLGHEITGEVIECGSDVEFIKNGDLCSVPFNIACGRCELCKAGDSLLLRNCPKFLSNSLRVAFVTSICSSAHLSGSLLLRRVGFEAQRCARVRIENPRPK
jgi:threonine dehydrogenase-like Zn-dependent dehydrogenase